MYVAYMNYECVKGKMESVVFLKTFRSGALWATVFLKTQLTLVLEKITNAVEASLFQLAFYEVDQ